MQIYLIINIGRVLKDDESLQMNRVTIQSSSLADFETVAFSAC
jgi:hypothetical protein